MITSLQNTIVKHVVALRDKNKRQRDGVFVIEGDKEISHAIDAGISLESVIYCAELITDNDRLDSVEAIEQCAVKSGGQAVEVASHVYAKMAYRQKVGGVLAIAQIPNRTIEDMSLGERPILLVVQGVEKPGNLGAILRTADGAGVDAVIVVSDGGADIWNPNVVRASLGALFTVGVLAMDMGQIKETLKQLALPVVMTTPATSKDYTAIDYTQGAVIVLGSEHDGLPEEWLSTEPIKVKIPMNGQMDSLNVSCSAAVMLYEALRQKTSSGRCK